MSIGVDVDVKNARLHTPMDLATEPLTKALINKATKTKNCESCKAKFDFKNIRFYCSASQKFFCKNCSSTGWVHENWDSEEQEKPVCRSAAISTLVGKHENELEAAMEAEDY